MAEDMNPRPFIIDSAINKNTETERIGWKPKKTNMQPLPPETEPVDEEEEETLPTKN